MIEEEGEKGSGGKGRDWNLSFPVIDYREIKG
jgi:hypothetical protein